jgi:ERF superfamily protein
MNLPAENIRQLEITQPAALTPMALIERAMANNAGMDVIEKFMDMQERWDKTQARKAFDAAIAEAKVEITPIQRNATGHNDKRYADFAAIARVVDPILGKHGLSYRFRTQQAERISVTCILSHKAGHYEETTLSGPADTSGNKNAIQAIGSTLTYLQRYSLVQMLGLAAAADDDGRSAASGGMISLEQVEELVALADEVGADKEAFCRYFKVDGFAMISVRDFPRAIAALNKKRSAK